MPGGMLLTGITSSSVLKPIFNSTLQQWPLQTAQQNFKVQKWITALSVVLFAVKIIAYYFTHSLAILSDALESIVNVVAGFIGLYSLYVAAKPKDIQHPYGHGKAEFISAAAEINSAFPCP